MNKTTNIIVGIIISLFAISFLTPNLVLGGGCPNVTGTCSYGPSFHLQPNGTCGGPETGSCDNAGGGNYYMIGTTYYNGNCSAGRGEYYHTYCCKVYVCGGGGATPDPGGGGGTVLCPGVTKPVSGAVNTTATSVNLNWTNGTGGNTRFLIFDTQSIALNPITTNTYTFNNLTPNTVYHWNVIEQKSASNWKGFSGCKNDTTKAFTTNQLSNGSWWQVKDGDITTNGSIFSDVYATDFLELNGLGGFPGVPVYGGSLSYGVGGLSSKMWGANTFTSEGRLFNYAYFESLIPSDVVSGQVYSDGYRWTKIVGDYALPVTNYGATKNILFVTGNLTINGNITLTDGSGFFGAFVQGSIIVNPAVTSIDGLFVTDQTFSTGIGASQLVINGSVASYGTNGIAMERVLATTVSPAEVFNYDPNLIILFPQKLAYKRTRWSEVVPENAPVPTAPPVPTDPPFSLPTATPIGFDPPPGNN